MTAVKLFMLKILENYSTIRGKERCEFPFPFWDVVVITSSDLQQKEGFELQIAAKKQNQELPLVTYHVLADPPGNKIGSGGSTFETLSFLHSMYGPTLSSLKVLLIHAGGYSQRLPSHSLCGKLFSCLPIIRTDGRQWQVMDLKLALFLPLLKHLPPGVFVTASDDIETYVLDDSEISFDGSGFIALAHPSSLEVGATHGVYVLAEKDKPENSCWVGACSKVLQKPTIADMRQSGAIQMCLAAGEEYVFSDSAFFFNHSVTNKLLSALSSLSPLSCETDAYGDFLQPLGASPSNTYISKHNNGPELTRVRQGLYDLLAGTPLHILVLEKSRFYHVGTIKELIFHWTKDKDLAEELDLQKRTFTLFKPTENASNVNGVLMQSVIHPDSIIGEACILEFCDFSVPVICESSVISCCQLRHDSYGMPVIIPENVLLFTCSILVDGECGWSCGAMHFDDDVKQSFNVNCADDVEFMGRKLSLLKSVFGWKDSRDLFEGSVKCCSLWNAKLFPVCATMDEAFVSTLKMIDSILEGSCKSENWSGMRLSMEDFVKKKSLKEMIEYRGKCMSSFR